jgi:hypothetical protein
MRPKNNKTTGGQQPGGIPKKPRTTPPTTTDPGLVGDAGRQSDDEAMPDGTEPLTPGSSNESPAESSDPVSKTKGGNRRTTAIIGPIGLSVPLDVEPHLAHLRSGRFHFALVALEQLLESQPVDPAVVLHWIHTVFKDDLVRKHAATNPRLFVELIRMYRTMTLAGVPEASDDVLGAFLATLDGPGTAAVAGALVRAGWRGPRLLNGALRQWIVQQAGTLDPAVGALLLNMLWNSLDVDSICTLIDAGLDTTTTCYVDIGNKLDLEGYYDGYVQPLEHLLGHYLHTVSVLHPADGSPPPRNQDLSQQIVDEIVVIGELTTDAVDPANRRPGEENFALGQVKVAAAHQILQRLFTRGNAEILTSFAAVQASALVQQFVASPNQAPTSGTIWGFELIRLPYVQAAHLGALGKQPVRMWEMWAVVDQALTEETYRRLLAEPEPTIQDLVGKGLAKLDDVLDATPLEFPGIRDNPMARLEYKQAFIEQCSSYLRALAQQAPTIKFATASVRGLHEPKYLPALACKAGLWWAKKENMHVYYCLDGVKDTDVINFKTRKTEIINKYHTDPEAKQYVEVTTLAEIREILSNWDQFKDTVTFTRKGVFVTDAAVRELIGKMNAADELVAGTRLAPPRDDLLRVVWGSGKVEAAKYLDPDDPAFNGMSVETFHSVVAQLLLMFTAFDAVSARVLGAFLTSKGARVLHTERLLPAGFGDAYQVMIDTPEVELRMERAAGLLGELAKGTLPAAFKEMMAGAIKRFSTPGT